MRIYLYSLKIAQFVQKIKIFLQISVKCTYKRPKKQEGMPLHKAAYNVSKPCEAGISANRLQCKHPRLALGVIVLIGLLFVIFTFATPKLPLFQDPVMGGYGI